MKTTVLITRPLVVAAENMYVLKEKGFNPLLAPLLNIQMLNKKCPLDHKNISLFITSQISLLAMQDKMELLDPFLSAPCYCVGGTTALLARSIGFHDIRVGAGDGLALAEMLVKQSHKNIPVLYLSGTYTDLNGADFLKAHGFKIHEWQVYKATPVTELPEICVRALKEEKLHTALFFSTRTGQTFRKLMESAKLTDCCKAVHAVVMSEPIAEAIKYLPWQSVHIAEKPTLEYMVQALLKEQNHV